MALDEYGARVLAAICEAALAQAQAAGGRRLVNYNQLPGRAFGDALRKEDLLFLDLNDGILFQRELDGIEQFKTAWVWLRRILRLGTRRQRETQESGGEANAQGKILPSIGRAERRDALN
jgi:hypothetical protein